LTDALLSARDVLVRFGEHTALDMGALDLVRGETLTLVGANGSGKTTLLRVLGLLLEPDRGDVRFDGEPVSYRGRRALALRRRMAGVHQEPLLCRMNVFQNVALGLRFRGLSRAEVRRRVEPWLERFHIAHLRDRPARVLSGGEAQRTSLARALVLEPDVLLLDEPFSALDAPTRQGLLAEFREILGETPVTTVFTTHDRNEALVVGDRMAVLDAGRIAQVAPPDEVFRRPASEAVARFVGVENRFHGVVVGSGGHGVTVDLGPARVEVGGAAPMGAHVLVCVRPEDVALSPDEGAESNGSPNALSGIVTRVLPSDGLVRVELDCGMPVVTRVTRPAWRAAKLERGCRARARFAREDAHAIVLGLEVAAEASPTGPGGGSPGV
jgi:tungstate transport system ATP-binding protein